MILCPLRSAGGTSVASWLPPLCLLQEQLKNFSFWAKAISLTKSGLIFWGVFLFGWLFSILQEKYFLFKLPAFRARGNQVTNLPQYCFSLRDHCLLKDVIPVSSFSLTLNVTCLWLPPSVLYHAHHSRYWISSNSGYSGCKDRSHFVCSLALRTGRLFW